VLSTATSRAVLVHDDAAHAAAGGDDLARLAGGYRAEAGDLRGKLVGALQRGEVDQDLGLPLGGLDAAAYQVEQGVEAALRDRPGVLRGRWERQCVQRGHHRGDRVGGTGRDERRDPGGFDVRADVPVVLGLFRQVGGVLGEQHHGCGADRGAHLPRRHPGPAAQHQLEHLLLLVAVQAAADELVDARIGVVDQPGPVLDQGVHGRELHEHLCTVDPAPHLPHRALQHHRQLVRHISGAQPGSILHRQRGQLPALLNHQDRDLLLGAAYLFEPLPTAHRGVLRRGQLGHDHNV